MIITLCVVNNSNNQRDGWNYYFIWNSSGHNTVRCSEMDSTKQ